MHDLRFQKKNSKRKYLVHITFLGLEYRDQKEVRAVSAVITNVR